MSYQIAVSLAAAAIGISCIATDASARGGGGGGGGAKAMLAPKPWASARAQVPGASVEQSQRHPMQCHYMIPSLPADLSLSTLQKNLIQDQGLSLVTSRWRSFFRDRVGLSAGVSEMDGSSGGRLSREN